MKKLLLTGANGMLAHDFKKYCLNSFEIFGYEKQDLDITDIQNVEKIILGIKPDIILNCSAYTQVDTAEDDGKKICFDVNTLGVYNLAKLTNKYNIDFITISTDYVFDGKKIEGYNENDICNPINNYGMSKYLGEKLALIENINTIPIRTSWLYGGGMEYKNFVNTMLKLSENKKQLNVVNDQFGSPTYTKDLSIAIKDVIEKIENYRGRIMHLSNETIKNGVTWYDFTSKIFDFKNININLNPCSSLDFVTKAKRPTYSKLINNSDIKLRDWKEGLSDYLNNLM